MVNLSITPIFDTGCSFGTEKPSVAKGIAKVTEFW
jgi:hypothetical protein